MEKYRHLPEVFDHLDDLYRYAQFAGLNDLMEKIDAAREVTLQEIRKAKRSAFYT